MTTRLSLSAIAMVVLAAWPVAQTPPQQTPQTFRTGTDVVLVDVSVRRNNVPVTGLTAADFELRDNGVRQDIEAVEATAVPIDLSIVVDVSGNPRRPWIDPRPSPSKTAAAVDADVRQLTKLLRAGDRVRLFAVDTYVQQVWPLQPVETAPPVRALVFDGQSSLYDTLTTVLLQPVEPTRRHVVVASTKGLDSMSVINASGLRSIAARADAQLHLVMDERTADEEYEVATVQCSGPTVGAPAGGAPGVIAQASLGLGMGLCRPTHRFWSPVQRRLFAVCGLRPNCLHNLQPDGFELKIGAESTGGGLYQSAAFSEPTLLSTFAAAFENFRQSYVLRYTARGVRRPGWHQISVTVPKDPSLRITSRTGYAIDAPTNAPPPAPAPRPAAVVAAELRTLPDFAAAYGRGDYDAVNLGLRRFADPSRFITDFDRSGNPWPASPRREAVFALELAEAGIYSGRQEARDEGAKLLERFSRLVRDPIKPDAFERAWLIGALGMLQGTVRPATTGAFVDRALARFPDEPRFVLARAIVLDQQWPMSGSVGTGAAATRTAATPEHVAAVSAAYEAAAKLAAVRSEALVRWAWLLHRVGQTDEALAKLAEAANAGPSDIALNYLRELITARVLLTKDRAADAAAAFRRASAIAPGASSARVGLMNALVVLGQRDEAEKLAESLQTTKATVVDPWWIYWQGDYRRYPEALRALRELGR